MLISRGLTVREVAYRVGYRQPAQFAKAFRRHHGTSPSDYRAAHRGNLPDPQQRAARLTRETVGAGGLAARGFAAA
jgi:AraC-like DNA-binding protein